MEQNNLFLEKQTLFAVPLYQTVFPSHNKNHELYKTFIDDQIDNQASTIDLEHNSVATRRILHSIDVFDDLIYSIGDLCEELHNDFCISFDKSIAVSAMWATRCDNQKFIRTQYQTESFLYGVYFLQTPEESGSIEIELDITDRNYYSDVHPDDPNTLNSRNFKTLMPEGHILLMPSHLGVGYTTNLAKSQRYLLHFTLKVLR